MGGGGWGTKTKRVLGIGRMYMYAWNFYEIKWNNYGMGFICRMTCVYGRHLDFKHHNLEN